MILPSPSSSGTLIVDPSGTAAPDCARTLEDAVARLIGDEYHTIVVYGRDGSVDLGLLEYLAGTWPEFLRGLTVRCVSAAPVDERVASEQRVDIGHIVLPELSSIDDAHDARRPLPAETGDVEISVGDELAHLAGVRPQQPPAVPQLARTQRMDLGTNLFTEVSGALHE
jgi:hypothetical protein